MKILVAGNEKTRMINKEIFKIIEKLMEKEIKKYFIVAENFQEINFTFNTSFSNVLETSYKKNSLKAIKKIIEENEIDYFINLLDEKIEIKQFNPKKHTFVFDLKFVKDLSENEMFKFGFDSLQKSRSNLIILKNETNEKWMIVYPEKTFTSFSENNNIAKLAVEDMFKRGETNHPKSIQEKESSDISNEIYQEFHLVGKKLFEKGLLPEIEGGTYGNFSLKQDGIMYITGRGVHKGKLKKDEVCKIQQVEYIKNDGQVFANVFYEGNEKPSIDTAINFTLKDNATIHIHTDRIFANLPITGYNYPCGTKEELEEIQVLLADNPTLDIIQLYKHGLIATGETLFEALQKIEELIDKEVSLRRIHEEEFMEEEFQEWEEHYNENTKSSTGMIDIHNPNFVYVVFKGETKVGFLNAKPVGKTLYFVFYSLKKFTKKGMGLGENIIGLVTDIALNGQYDKIGILTTKECNVFSYYQKREFKKIFEDSQGIIWMDKRVRDKKTKYFLGKWSTTTTGRDEDSFGHTESRHTFGPTVETRKEAEKWAESNHGKHTEPYAFKGRKIKFDIRHKVKVKTTTTAIEED